MDQCRLTCHFLFFFLYCARGEYSTTVVCALWLCLRLSRRQQTPRRWSGRHFPIVECSASNVVCFLWFSPLVLTPPLTRNVNSWSELDHAEQIDLVPLRSMMIIFTGLIFTDKKVHINHLLLWFRCFPWLADRCWTKSTPVLYHPPSYRLCSNAWLFADLSSTSGRVWCPSCPYCRKWNGRGRWGEGRGIICIVGMMYYNKNMFISLPVLRRVEWEVCVFLS